MLKGVTISIVAPFRLSIVSLIGDNMRFILIGLIFITTSLFSQSIDFGKSRQSYSLQTQAILKKLDSLYRIDTSRNSKHWFEYRKVGEGGRVSEKFTVYAEMVENCTENDLLKILDSNNELAPIRGYAYMAYAYKCDREKKEEKNISYNFKLNTINGCIGSTDVSFSAFKKQIRIRNAYEPKPTRIIPDLIEQEVIKKENKIREEQGELLRKE